MILNPIVEYEIISKWVTALIGKKITPHNFVKRLGKHLNKRHSVKVKCFKDNDSKLNKGDFTFGGEYDPNLDEDERKQFKVYFLINHPKKSTWYVTEEMVNNIILDLVETLVHEYRHQHQYRSRQFMLNRGYVSKHRDVETKNNQEYLGMPDEIDAYSANIAARLYINKSVVHPDNSPDLASYYTAFGANHPVTRLLLKKIVLHINYLENNNNDNANRK